MSYEPTDTPESIDNSPQSDDPSGSPASSTPPGEDTGGERKRRRRRRGGRGRGGAKQNTPEESGDSITDTSEDPHTVVSEEVISPAGGDGEDGRISNRRGRGRGGKGRSEGSEQPRSTHPTEGHISENDDKSEPAKRVRERAQVEPTSKDWEEIFEGKTFADLGLRGSVLKGVEAAGFKNPTKIQSEMIPLIMSGKDVLGQSRTGTGKTAAFGLPLFHLATRDLPFQSLILAPTRELAIQIASELEELGKFTPIRVSAVYGGQNVGTQARALDKGPEIIVATPGRLMDMVERRYMTLKNVKFAVLDEVDRMLDIGFRDDIKKILGAIKSEHQTVFVSATISPEIEKLARTHMKSDAEKLVTTGGSLTVSLVEQHYIACEHWDKRAMLLHVLTHEDPDLTVVFCRMKRTVDDLAKYLTAKGIDAHAIHGDMYQGKRNAVMRLLREGTLGVLVASDLAARGLDVDGISHVVNYDLPDDPEVYIHRIGRTARAGRRGVAWSLVSPDQGDLLTAIEMLANTHIPEKKYPDFKPGSVPSDVRARRQADSQRTDTLRQIKRSAPPTLPAAVSPAGAAPIAPDLSKFPGGIVPTKLPPKMLGGRVRSARAMKQMMAQGASAQQQQQPPAPPAPASPPTED